MKYTLVLFLKDIWDKVGMGKVKYEHPFHITLDSALLSYYLKT